MNRVKKPAARKSVKKRAKPRTKALAVKQDNSLSIVSPDPGAIMKFGQVLNKYILDNKLSVKIEDKQYPLCGAWKFAAMNFGLTAIPTRVTPKHKEGQYITILWAKREFEGHRKDGTKYTYTKDVPIFSGFTHHKEVIDGIRAKNKITKEVTRPYYAYECEVEVTKLNDGRIVQKGISVCSNLESLKSGFDEYAVMGQAQTRTISRSLRNLLDFVLSAAGMEPTPGEEMEQVHENEKTENAPYAEEVTSKIKFDDAKMSNAVDMILKGEKTLADIREQADLTPDQDKALQTTEENYLKNKR